MPIDLYVQVIKYALRNLHAQPGRDEVSDLAKIVDIATRVLPPLVAAEAHHRVDKGGGDRPTTL